jgi:hypothetical protein
MTPAVALSVPLKSLRLCKPLSSRLSRSSRSCRVAQSVQRPDLRRASCGGAHSVFTGSGKPCPFAPARLSAPALTASQTTGRPGPPSRTSPARSARPDPWSTSLSPEPGVITTSSTRHPEGADRTRTDSDAPERPPASRPLKRGLTWADTTAPERTGTDSNAQINPP